MRMLDVRTEADRALSRGGSMAEKTERLNVRLDAKDRLLIETAAASAGLTISEFLLQSARQKAEEQILDEQIMVVPSETFDWLLDLVEAPAKHDEKFERTLQRVRDNNGGKLPWEQ